MILSQMTFDTCEMTKPIPIGDNKPGNLFIINFIKKIKEKLLREQLKEFKRS